MDISELLLLVGFTVVILLLVRIDRSLKRVLSMETIYRERQNLENTVRDFMPTLWGSHEFRDNIVSWFVSATGPHDKIHQKEWHWSSIANNLSKSKGRITPGEIESLCNLSNDFFHEANQSHLLTELEVRYLLFWLWNLNFSDPTVAINNDVASFENELANIRNRFLK